MVHYVTESPPHVRNLITNFCWILMNVFRLGSLCKLRFFSHVAWTMRNIAKYYHQLQQIFLSPIPRSPYGFYSPFILLF